MSLSKVQFGPLVMPGQRNAAAAGLDPDAIVGRVYEGRPLVTDHHQYIPSHYWANTTAGPHSAVMFGLDVGNSGTRTAAINPINHHLTLVETPATYEESQTLTYTMGEAVEVWTELYYEGEQRRLFEAQFASAPHAMPPQYSDPFRVGVHANPNKSLPIGATNERLSDPRYMRYVKACLVRTLMAAGYQPGHYYLGGVIGVRNEETTADLGADPAVAAAFGALGKPFTLIRNQHERWTIELVDRTLIPQSFGAHYALDTDLYGRILHPDVPQWTYFDIGYHDAHIEEVIRAGRSLRVTGQKVAQGVSEIARGMALFLRQPGQFPKLPELSDAEAQEVMQSEVLRIGGIPLDDEQGAKRAARAVQEYKEKHGGALIATLVSYHPRMDSIFVFGGGGSIVFAQQIEERMQETERPRHLYKVLPPEVARYANVIGLYWLMNIQYRAKAVV